ncbi:MAG: type II toxin-antitoxin system PemK/MazF family toxin [Patescibacteria group bacterium]
MKKDFAQWHEKKTKLNDDVGVALFHEREVWWCALGVNIGYEQDGGGELFTRPVVIITKFSLDVCLVVPLTARPKKGKFYFSLGQIDGREAVATLSQLRFVDRKRLAKKIGTLDITIFHDLVARIVEVCFPALS